MQSGEERRMGVGACLDCASAVPLHAVCDGQGRPVTLLLSEGQMSDYKGAALLLPSLPKAKERLADRG